MFKWLAGLFKPVPDKIEECLLKQFSFLIHDYGFTYAKEELGNAIDKDGEFFFYGPLNAYQFYNDKVCIHILHLVQRDDYDVYITDKKSADQVYIRNGIRAPDCFANNFQLLKGKVKESIVTHGELFGHKT